jgi:hypothetical protein
MIIEQFDTEHFSAHYDTDQRILFVTYRGVLTPQVTIQFYQWLGKMIQNRPELVAEALGSIFDFRQVTEFDHRNLTSAQRQSQQVNTQVDLSHHPVAMIVGSMLQEQILRLELKISPQQTRKRIVRSEEAALTFINRFQSVEKKPDKIRETSPEIP